MWTLSMIALGLLIGWQFPQPQIAKDAIAGVVRGVKFLWQKYVGGNTQ